MLRGGSSRNEGLETGKNDMGLNKRKEEFTRGILKKKM